jgi:hypothetical protein
MGRRPDYQTHVDTQSARSERNSVNMMEMVVGALLVIIAATTAMFLILIAVNIVLFLTLKSNIPQKAFSNSEHAT